MRIIVSSLVVVFIAIGLFALGYNWLGVGALSLHAVVSAHYFFRASDHRLAARDSFGEGE